MKHLIFLHLISFSLGFVLDFIFGDPHFAFHPVRGIGALISFFENSFIGKKGHEKNISAQRKRFYGLLTVILVCLITSAVSALIIYSAWKIHPVLFCSVEAIMIYFLLAARSLKSESMKVYEALTKNTESPEQNLIDARLALSMIVGRDTENLNEEAVCKATVETISENTSDGIIAPMLFAALGGPVFGFFYKAVNTMDSMIGYKNERYLDFGRIAAKTDDVLNFIPARLSALFMIAATGLCRLFLSKKFLPGNALQIFIRDRYNHQSPNSAQTESACAGALGLQLAGPASYEGVVEQKPFIGGKLRNIEPEDIKRANSLMYVTTFICFLLCSGIMVLIMVF